MKAAEVIRAIEQAGCTFLRQRGSHRTYRAPGGQIFVMPYHSQTQEMAPWQVRRQLRGTGLEQYGANAMPKDNAQVEAVSAPRASAQRAPRATGTGPCPKCKGSQPLYVRTVRAGTTAQVYGMPHYFAVPATVGYCARCRGHYPI